jgi:predicted secreted protein
VRWTSILAIYFIIWFLCLFLVLPFHGRSAHEAADGRGQDPGAPRQFEAGRIVAQVSVLAAIVFGIYYANYVQGWIGIDDIDLAQLTGHRID